MNRDMNPTIIPTTIELEADITEIKDQYMKEQITNPIILFGHKYGILNYTVDNIENSGSMKNIIKLVLLDNLVE